MLKSIEELVGQDIILRPDVLKDTDPSDLSRFLIGDGKLRFIRRINDTAKDLLLSCEVPGHIPAFAEDPDFQTKWYSRWYIALKGRVCRNSSKGSVISLVFPLAVYLYECYGLSCSKLILGCEMKTVPPLWLRSWLEQVEYLTTEETAQLYSLLEKGTKVNCDTVFVLKSRFAEMAAERGIEPDDFLLGCPGISLSQDIAFIREFTQARFLEQGTPYLDMKAYIGTHRLLRLMILLAIYYGISPDYLLLQDYSNFAVTPEGRFYPPVQRRMMSMLFALDTEARNEAVAFVMNAVADRIKAGEKVTTLASPEQSAVDVIQHFIEADEGQRSVDTEQQLIESLKEKVYEILRLSGTPVSSAKLYQIVEGHHRVVRKALLELVKEGKVLQIKKSKEASAWQIAPGSATKAQKNRT